jgi:hypothetical protein
MQHLLGGESYAKLDRQHGDASLAPAVRQVPGRNTFAT